MTLSPAVFFGSSLAAGGSGTGGFSTGFSVTGAGVSFSWAAGG